MLITLNHVYVPPYLLQISFGKCWTFTYKVYYLRLGEAKIFKCKLTTSIGDILKHI